MISHEFQTFAGLCEVCEKRAYTKCVTCDVWICHKHKDNHMAELARPQVTIRKAVVDDPHVDGCEDDSMHPHLVEVFRKREHFPGDGCEDTTLREVPVTREGETVCPDDVVAGRERDV